jgi:hypothetical protein
MTPSAVPILPFSLNIQGRLYVLQSAGIVKGSEACDMSSLL